MSDLSEDEGSFSEVDEKEGTKRREIIPVNNVPGLNAKLKAVQLNLDWIEKLDTCVNVENVEPSTDLNDKDADAKPENDFKREMSFYNQAISAVAKAFKRLKKLNIATKRPTDYYAEMAKSDSHMKKVREKLLSKQTAVERREHVRAIREQKKQGKKIQREILQEKKSEKKKMLNALKKTKKGKMGADELLKEKQNGPAKSRKGKMFREVRDKKYGYGGKKRGSKWNTAESSAVEGKQGGGKQNNRYFQNKKFGNNNQRPKKHRRRR